MNIFFLVQANVVMNILFLVQARVVIDIFFLVQAHDPTYIRKLFYLIDSQLYNVTDHVDSFSGYKYQTDVSNGSANNKNQV